MSRQRVAEAFTKPKGIYFHCIKPGEVWKAVKCPLSGCIEICANIVELDSWAKRSSGRIILIASRKVMAFNLPKAIL